MRPLFVLAALSLPLAGSAFEMAPVLHMDLRGGTAMVQDQKQTNLIQGQIFAVPAMKLSERAVLLPSLFYIDGGQQRSLDAPAPFVRTSAVGFRPQFKQRSDDGSAWSVKADLRHSYNVDTVDEPMGKGLFDHEDYGLGGGYDRKWADLPVGASLNVGHRSYPNYRGIASELTQNKDFYQKDYNSAQGEGHVELAPFGRLGGSLEWRNYPDSYVVDAESGLVQMDKLQNDMVVDLGLRGGVAMDEAGHLGLGWDLSWEGLQSNQNTYDAVRLEKLPNATNYSTYTVGLNTQWRPGETWSVTGGYQACFRNFNRKIQTTVGDYQMGLVAEVEHDLSAGFRIPMAWDTAFVGGGEAHFLLSNQQFAAAGPPSYNYFSGSLGLQWDWKTAQ